MRITLKDVGKKAGVSHNTVSLVVNNSDRVSEGTRNRVLKAIEELGYRPNRIAQNLVKGRTNVVAVIIPEIESDFAVRILKGVENQRDDSGLDVMILSGRDIYSTAVDHCRRHDLFRRVIKEAKADGIIYVTPMKTDIEQERDRVFEIPVVLVESDMDNAYSITFDNKKAGRLGAEYLIDKGYKNIALAIGDTVNMESQRERFKGFTEVLSENNIDFNKEDDICRMFLHHYSDGRKIFNWLEARQFRYDAVFCAGGDSAALGLINTALKRGFSIPENFGVLGFDNCDMSESFALTTIEQPVYSMGTEAFNMIKDHLDSEENVMKKKVFHPRIIEREST